MESFFCTLCPAKLPSLKFYYSMAVTPPSSLTCASVMESPSRRKSAAPRNRSSKPISQTASPQIPTTPTTSNSDSTAPISAAPPKKVLVPIGFGTEEMEAVILIDVLRRAGAKVTVASVEPQLEIEAAAGSKLVADISISDCSDETFDLVALPVSRFVLLPNDEPSCLLSNFVQLGGMPGSARLRDCEVLRRITSKQADEERLYGAICAAPAVTLLPWGLLRKKQITCHPAFMDKLPTFWAVKSNLQVSGKVTTSRGPGTSFQFALSFVDQLFGETVAKEVAEMLLMDTGDDNCRKEELNPTEWSFEHNPRVLIPIANGSEEIEVVTIVDILRRANVEVVVASVGKSVQILGSQGTKMVADKFIDEAAEFAYDLIVLPGGSAGSDRLQKSKVLKKLLQEQDAGGRIYGAVCSSLFVLQKHCLLKDKRIAAHPSIGNKLTNEMVNSAKVVIDGRLITCKGLATVMDFALAIVTKLFGHARARSVAEGLVLEYIRT
ncbi:unnamed protein product [Linum tenue]|uniref:DJ-1/PfpI domain-containing protein n=1 Tax=Linum tenue TaxID=586396 RepID=A0AAV0MNA2_9ROSI|nr:unnamed protein product [Linum tenue]